MLTNREEVLKVLKVCGDEPPFHGLTWKPAISAALNTSETSQAGLYTAGQVNAGGVPTNSHKTVRNSLLFIKVNAHRTVSVYPVIQSTAQYKKVCVRQGTPVILFHSLSLRNITGAWELPGAD